METSDRKTPADLTRGLAEDPQAYNFFRAVRLLEARHRDRPRIGKSIDPRQDPVRFGQHPGLTFSRSTIDSFTEGGDQPHQLFVNFMGLFGPNGPLPLHITDYARDRESNAKDRTIAGFLNVFHHRMLSLFYRAWAVNQKAVDLDRPEEASFARFIASFIGLGIPEVRNRDSVSDWAKLYYAGWLSSQTRNAEGLETILGDYFQMPIRIISFVGHWLRLPEHSVCRLGEQRETGTLGQSAVIGSRVWDCQLKFRVRIGPVGLAQMQRLLPGGKTFIRLQDWVRGYCGDEYLWDAQVVLKKEEVPSIQLGGGGLLGWTTWLKSKPTGKDAEDLILEPKLG